MALIVEDGTGLANAESYLSLADFKSYCAGRLLDLGGKSDADLEAWLRIGTSYIDAEYRYKGQRQFDVQALAFPRLNCTDWDGKPAVGIFKRLKDACAEAAFTSGGDGLYVAADRGGMIKSESVGPISVTYMDGAPSGTLYANVESLMRPYILETSAEAMLRTGTSAPPVNMRTGGAGPPPADPYFSRGMHDWNKTPPNYQGPGQGTTGEGSNG